ncbi:hypothetical protein CHS0354_016590 [Potamilus streckersoni]|uniref:Uncharacterized protein n=1 Tax=Potamilus streckersoni TaxID=2493646 RepID=A0AAE0TKL3_9BIVA|nr:hypothetical protein CHS0354_016590 [Potamilus streckersoni]
MTTIRQASPKRQEISRKDANFVIADLEISSSSKESIEEMSTETIQSTNKRRKPATCLLCIATISKKSQDKTCGAQQERWQVLRRIGKMEPVKHTTNADWRPRRGRRKTVQLYERVIETPFIMRSVLLLCTLLSSFQVTSPASVLNQVVWNFNDHDLVT